MSFYNKIKWWIYNWIGFILVVWLTSVAYWAYVSMSNVAEGTPLTATSYNQLIDNVTALKTTVDWLSNVPAWAVMAFNLSLCPTWWIAANWSGGTIDLRWEFIRWWDNGRWIDSWRSLATWQDSTSISSPVFYGTFWSSTNFAWIGFNNQDSFTQTNYPSSVITTLWSWAAWTSLSSTAWWDFKIRPRNVALLYCIKQ